MARVKSSSLKKVQGLVKEIDAAITDLVNASEVESPVESGANKASGGVGEICKLLQAYPGLTRDTLKYVKSEVARFKRYGMLKQLKNPDAASDVAAEDVVAAKPVGGA